MRFLAILELFKVRAWSTSTRSGQFGDIHIVWLGPAEDAATTGEVLESIDVYEG